MTNFMRDFADKKDKLSIVDTDSIRELTIRETMLLEEREKAELLASKLRMVTRNIKILNDKSYL